MTLLAAQAPQRPHKGMSWILLVCHNRQEERPQYLSHLRLRSRPHRGTRFCRQRFLLVFVREVSFRVVIGVFCLSAHLTTYSSFAFLFTF